MQCKDLESVLALEDLASLPVEVREHLEGCAHCQDFLADLDTIVATAKTLSTEVTPPDRVWVSLRAQLEAEGLIKEPVEAPERAAWWENLKLLWRPRSLVTAGAALALVATAIFVSRTPQSAKIASGQPAQTQKVSGPTQPSNPSTSAPVTAPPITAKNSAQEPPHSRMKELAPSPTENASTTLSETELDVSNMRLAGNGVGNAQVDASLRQNLRTLNEFIAECEQHLRQNPQDELAREYLYTAYQQKADLLAAMMESGRSEH